MRSGCEDLEITEEEYLKGRVVFLKFHDKRLIVPFRYVYLATMCSLIGNFGDKKILCFHHSNLNIMVKVVMPYEIASFRNTVNKSSIKCKMSFLVYLSGLLKK